MGPVGSPTGPIVAFRYLSAVLFTSWPRTALMSTLVSGVVLVSSCAGGAEPDTPSATDGFDTIEVPTDYSGLAWIGSDDAGGAQYFLAVHDAKNTPEKRDRVRVTVLRSAADGSGAARQPLRDLEFPTRGRSNDLESAARIPDRQAVLLVESGNGGDKPGADSGDADAGIYLATYDFADGSVGVELVSYTKWPATPTPLGNVEATAVAAGAGSLWFVYAERASGSATTMINWTTFDIGDDGSLTFGTKWRSVPFTRPGPVDARPASALEIGPDGSVYVASAWDPDDDGGPFESAVWNIGVWNDASADIDVFDEPVLVARSDGFKIEAVAVAGDGPDAQVFIGVDDEDYGATLRPLRPR
jgi:hypothetical protein